MWQTSSSRNEHHEPSGKHLVHKLRSGSPPASATSVRSRNLCRAVAAVMPYPPARLFTIPSVRLFTSVLLTLGLELRGSGAALTYPVSASI